MNHHRYKKEKEFLPIIPGSSEIVSMAGDDKKIYYPVKHSGDHAGVILLVFLSMFSTHFCYKTKTSEHLTTFSCFAMAERQQDRGFVRRR